MKFTLEKAYTIFNTNKHEKEDNIHAVINIEREDNSAEQKARLLEYKKQFNALKA